MGARSDGAVTTVGTTTESISRGVMFAGLFFLAPLPYFLVEVGLVPPARLVQITGHLLALIVSEGGQGAVVAAALLIGLQALAYSGLVFVVAVLSVRLLARLAPRAFLPVTVGLVGIALLCAMILRPYATPFSVEAARNGLVGLYR